MEAGVVAGEVGAYVSGACFAWRKRVVWMGPLFPQLRREARLRREYLYRKAREEAERTAQERKDKVRRALEGTCVPRSPIFSRDRSFKTQQETGPNAVKRV